jgi:hypothetical protein
VVEVRPPFPLLSRCTNLPPKSSNPILWKKVAVTCNRSGVGIEYPYAPLYSLKPPHEPAGNPDSSGSRGQQAEKVLLGLFLDLLLSPIPGHLADRLSLIGLS